MRALLPSLLAVSFFPAAHAASPFTDRYADVQAEMRALAATSAGRSNLFELGRSDGGAAIEGLSIGSGEVAHLVVATHHGNEYGSTEVARALMRSLAADPLPGLVVHVIPVLNTGGYDRRARAEEAAGTQRDPNRDYPGPCGSEGPHALKSTAALAGFLELSGAVLTATLHTRHPAVVWPWGFGTPDLETEHTDLFRALAQAATVESGYEVGNSTEVLYPAPGTYEDYAFWRHGSWALLFELGHTHRPTQAELGELVRVNVPGLRRLLAQAPRQRAERHAFAGRCDDAKAAGLLDRHDE